MNIDRHRRICWAWAGWEPDRHYRRMGGSSTPFFGRGQWLSEWRSRLDDERTLHQLRDAGVNTLVTWCYKGFGIDLESAEWPVLRQFIDNAHKANMHVWGYVQSGSLYLETLANEQPTAHKWAARQYDGNVQTWAGHYYRAMPCLRHPDYLAYMEQVLCRAAAETSLDGIHLDNSYFKHCWCDRCQSAFRDWLNDAVDLDECLGLTNANHVAAPPLPPNQERYGDPLQQLWMEFGVRTRLAALQLFRRALGNTRSGLWMIGNPAFPRKACFKARLAFDPAREGRVFDGIFAENGNLSRMIGDSYVSQVEAYRYAEAGQYRVLNTSWQPGATGHAPPSTAAQIWTQAAEEFSHGVATQGNNWALRPAPDGSGLLLDNTSLFTSFANAMRFFRMLDDNRQLRPRQVWAELAVLIQPDTMTLAGDRDVPAFRGLLQELLRRHVPFQVVFGGQPIPQHIQALLVWQQSCLPDTVLTDVRLFAARPGAIALVAGDSGRFDEHLIPRSGKRWAQWLASPKVVYHAADSGKLALTTPNARYLDTDVIAATAACRDALQTLLATSNWRPHLIIDAPPYALVNVEHTEPNRLLVHLRDQSATGQLVTHCQVHLRGVLAHTRQIGFYFPGEDGQVRSASPQVDQQTGNDMILTLPPFCHYALLELSYTTPVTTEIML